VLTRLLPVLALSAVYFLPVIIALRRRHPDVTWIFFINLFLGPSGLGWLAALRRSLRELYKTCPQCDGDVKAAAKVCPHGRYEFPLAA
jgi:hypothetical protein